jgi:hypothetical protein
LIVAREVAYTNVLYAATAIIAISSLAGIYRSLNFDLPLRNNTYRVVGEWIEENTEQDVTLMLGDLGVVGYYAERYTMDNPGLIVPGMYFKTQSYAVLKYKLDYVVATQFLAWQQTTASHWFNYHYEPLVQLSTEGDVDFSPMVAYQRRLETIVPGQAIQGFDLPLTCIVDLDEGTALPVETSARLIAIDGAIVAETAHPFLWDMYPEANVPVDERLTEQIALPLMVEPGEYRWELECDSIQSGNVDVLPVEQAAGYMPLEVEWSGFTQLRGVALNNDSTLWSGGTLEVAFHFDVLDAMDEDYSFFVHLVAVNGDKTPLAQADGFPRNGERPTSTWQPGETIVDIISIALPPDLTGTYTLLAGWYDWQSGQRISSVDGQDAISIPLEFEVRFPGGSGLP